MSDTKDQNEALTPEVIDKKKGKAKIQEKSFGRKVRDAFISEEVQDLKSYAVFDVLIPAVKRTFRNLIVNSLDISLFGRAGSDRPYDQRGGSTYISYDRAYDRAYGSSQYPGDRREPRSRQRGETIGVRDLSRIHFWTRNDAQEVYMMLEDKLTEYPQVTTADFISFANEVADLNLVISPQHHKWGWYDLMGASIEVCPDDDSYYIVMPRPRSL